MSGAYTASQLYPRPERWGAMRAGNTDTRARDAAPDLQTINDTIATAQVEISRRDGQPMEPIDLSWTGAVALDATRTLVTIGLAVGNPPGLTANTPVDYVVTITVTTTGGRILSWDTYQLVVAQIG